MQFRHDIDRAFDALTWLAQYADPRKRHGLAITMEIARTLFIAMPRAVKGFKLVEAERNLLARIDLLKTREPENMRTALQMVSVIQVLTSGLLLLARDRKPPQVFYTALLGIELERGIADTVKIDALAARHEITHATKDGPLRRLAHRILPGRRAQHG